MCLQVLVKKVVFDYLIGFNVRVFFELFIFYWYVYSIVVGLWYSITVKSIDLGVKLYGFDFWFCRLLVGDFG